MKHFSITGALIAKDFIVDAIANEWQIEIRGSDGKKLLVVFYKGTWGIQDPSSKDYFQMYDAPDIMSTPHTIGLCEFDDVLKPNPLWVSFAKERLAFHNASTNGTVVTSSQLDNLDCRVIPARVMTDLIYSILHDIESVHVVSKHRNGTIKNGSISA